MNNKSFTVGTLIEFLQGLDPSLPVLLSEDEEGNRFHELFFVEERKACFHEREIDLIHPEDLKHWDQEDLRKVVVLWP